MDSLREAYAASATYPHNVKYHQTYQHVLQRLEGLLRLRGGSLCVEATKGPEVNVWQCMQPGDGENGQSGNATEEC
jgi:hypothetical protein